MTEETAIERLDYGKPPPGYRVFEDGWWGAPVEGESWMSARLAVDGAPCAHAWADFKRRNDPPGVWAGQARGEHDGGYGFGLTGVDAEHPLEADFEVLADARAAAWTWHDRRHALAGKLDADYRLEGPEDCESGTSAWPRCLTWPDEQVAEVERAAHDLSGAVREQFERAHPSLRLTVIDGGGP